MGRVRNLFLRNLAFALAMVWSMAAARSTASGPPSNDSFGARAPLQMPQSVEGSNENASREPGEPFHAGVTNAQQTIWWTWLSDTAGPVRVTTAGSAIDTVLAVYTGLELNQLEEVASNDDTPVGGNFSSVAFDAKAGQSFHIAVAGFGGEQGAVRLTLDRILNDDFKEAASLGRVAEVTVDSNNSAATIEPGELHGCSTNAENTLWWTWSAPAAGVYSISTVQSDFNTVLAVYRGTALPSLTPVACNDDTPRYEDKTRRQSHVSLSAAAFETFAIAVGGKRGSSGELRLSIAPRPANDDRGEPQTLDSSSTLWTNLSSSGASREEGEPAHAPGSDGAASVWFRWTAPTSGLFAVSVPQADFNAAVGVYQNGDAGFEGLREIASASGTGIASFRADAGAEVAVAVDGMAPGDAGKFSLSIAPEGPVPDSVNAEVSIRTPRDGAKIKRREGRGFSVRGIGKLLSKDAKIVGAEVALEPRAISGTSLSGYSPVTKKRVSKNSKRCQFRHVNLGAELPGGFYTVLVRLAVVSEGAEGTSTNFTAAESVGIQLIRP